MLSVLHRFHGRVVKLLLFMGAMASMAVDRIFPAGEGLELISSDAHDSPQQMLVRLTSIMIAGSLTMFALGYSAPARAMTGRS